MIKALAGSVLTLALLSAAPTADAKTRTFFVGTVTAIGVQGCDKILNGQKYNSLYQIAKYEGNDNFSAFSTLSRYSGDVYELDSDVFSSSYKRVKAVRYGAGFGGYSANVRLVKSSPPTVTSSTQTVTVTFQIDGARKQPGCNLTVKGSLTKTTNE